MQLAEEEGDHHHDHNHTFNTWSFETERPLSLDALKEMVKRRLPGNIYRCKGIVNSAENPDRRAILQVVGRRSDVILEEEWDNRRPQTQIVAIGAPGSIDDEALTALFTSCLAESDPTTP